MKKIPILCMLVIAIIMLTQCATKTVEVLTTSNVSAEKIAVIKKQFSTDQMERGMKLYEVRCIECHELHEPSEFNIERWEDILPGMSRRAHLSDEQASLVRAFLLTNAR